MINKYELQYYKNEAKGSKYIILSSLLNRICTKEAKKDLNNKINNNLIKWLDYWTDYIKVLKFICIKKEIIFDFLDTL